MISYNYMFVNICKDFWTLSIFNSGGFKYFLEDLQVDVQTNRHH